MVRKSSLSGLKQYSTKGSRLELFCGAIEAARRARQSEDSTDSQIKSARGRLLATVLDHTEICALNDASDSTGEQSGLRPLNVYLPQKLWADKGSENTKRNEYYRLSDDTLKRIRAMYEDGVKDPSLKWTAEQMQRSLLREMLPFHDKVLLKLSYVKSKLKPMTAREKANSEEEQSKVEEAKARLRDGLPPRHPWRRWVLHFPGMSNAPEYVDLNSGETRTDKPEELVDEEVDAAVEELASELVLAEEGEDQIEGYTELEDSENVEADDFFTELNLPEDLTLYGELEELSKRLYRLYYCCAVNPEEQSLLNDQVCAILNKSQVDIHKVFFDAGYDPTLLKQPPQSFNIPSRRNALAYFKRDMYYQHLANGTGSQPSGQDLERAFALLSPEEKRPYEKKELQDGKRFFLEKFIFNNGKRKERLFSQDDIVATRTGNLYKQAKVVAGNGKEFSLTLTEDGKRIDKIPGNKIVLVPRADVEESLVQDFAEGEQFFVRSTLHGTDFKLAKYAGPSSNGMLNKFIFDADPTCATVELPTHCVLCRQKRKLRNGLNQASNDIKKWKKDRLIQELKKRNLSTSGNKPVLLSRLQEAMTSTTTA